MRTTLEGQSDFLVSAPTSAVFCRSSLTRMKLNFLSDLTGDADSVRTVGLLETWILTSELELSKSYPT